MMYICPANSNLARRYHPLRAGSLLCLMDEASRATGISNVAGDTVDTQWRWRWISTSYRYKHGRWAWSEWNGNPCKCCGNLWKFLETFNAEVRTLDSLVERSMVYLSRTQIVASKGWFLKLFRAIFLGSPPRMLARHHPGLRFLGLGIPTEQTFIYPQKNWEGG